MTIRPCSYLRQLHSTIVPGFPFHPLAPDHQAMLPSGRPIPLNPPPLGNPRNPIRDLKLRSRHHRALDLLSAPLVRPTFTGAPRARPVSSASTTGSDTRMSFTSAGESTLALNRAAIVASGAPTRSISTTSNATVARLVLMLKRWSSFSVSASTGLVDSAQLFIPLASDTSNMSRVISNLA